MRAVTVTVGAVISTTSSFVVASLPTFPAGSVAVTATLWVPSATVLSALSASVHVPSPLLVAVSVCPSTVRITIAAASSTLPPSGGVWSFVTSDAIETTGTVTS